MANTSRLLPMKSIDDSLLTNDAQYMNTAMSAIQLLMLTGMWIVKLKKRLRTNEEKVRVMERKMSQLMKNRVTEL